MRIQAVVAVTLVMASTLCAGRALAESVPAIGRVEMQVAIATKVSDQAAQRAAIQRLLERPEVRDLAANSGLNLARAKAAAATLEGSELERLAAQAATAQAQLAGGATTIYLTTGALIIILLIVILLAG